MEEFQNRKFHKGREVSHLSNTNYHCLLSKSLQGALQKLFCNFFPQRRLGTTQILNLFWEEEKKPLRWEGCSYFCNFFCPNNRYFSVHFWCICSPLRDICIHLGSGTWLSLGCYCKKRRTTRPSWMYHDGHTTFKLKYVVLKKLNILCPQLMLADF